MEVSDKSNKILDKANTLAKRFDAKITGIYVMPIQPPLTSGYIDDSAAKKAEKLLRPLKIHCENKGIHFAFKIFYGKPASEIAKFAEKGKVDLVVIGTKGLGGFKGKVLGSVANSILQESKVSVLLVR